MKHRIRNLDTFRAIAAFIVLIAHVTNSIEVHWQHKLYAHAESGHTGVMLFFVISGFLISFLLTKEKNKYGTISLKDFYMRRILRIWPLYFLVLGISSFFWSTIPDRATIFYAVSIMPNISRALYYCDWAVSPQIWSVGVENQFYLFFPLLILFFSKKMIPWLLCGFILIYTFGGQFILDFINSRTFHSPVLTDFNYRFCLDNKFNSLAIGCLFGFLYAENKNILKYFYCRWLNVVSTIVAIIIWSCNIQFMYKDEFMSLLFAFIILNVCTNTTLNITFENRVSKFFGKISYGIYMYHWIVLMLAFRIFPLTDSVCSIVFLYVFVLGVTIICAWISYETFEKHFLDLKKRFERE